MTYAMPINDLWSIILAGGDGERLMPFVQRWLGRHKPKQYCTFIGTRSMFQHTLDRADLLSLPDHKITLIAESHCRDAFPQFMDRCVGKLIIQPTNRDTAPGVFLPLTYIRACNPQATVVLYPSDHFVYPEDQFMEAVKRAVWAANLLPNHLILLAVSPDRVEPEYGWIQLGQQFGWVGGYRLSAVGTFLEKPNSNRARQAMLSGGLWNTLILAAKVEAIWSMGWRCFPQMMPLFEQYGKAIGTSEEKAVLKAIYQVMPSRNFSSNLLQCIPEQIAAMEMREVLWADWGSPERIVDTLQRIGKYPAFARECTVTV